MRVPPKGQLFKQALMKVGHLRELASSKYPLKGKVQIREEVGAGAGGTLQPDPGLTVALGYEKHIYITFSGTTKA